GDHGDHDETCAPFAWASIYSNPNANDLRDQIYDPCEAGAATVGDIVTMNRGTITSALQEVETQLIASDLWWDEDLWGEHPPADTSTTFYQSTSCTGSAGGCYGQVIEGPIMLFNSGTPCGADTQFEKQQVLTGFAYAVIFDVTTQGSSKDIRAIIDMSNEWFEGKQPGPLDTNVLWDAPPGLVR
ncbi:MAG: hypothetical protein HN348_11250, partial [Proteobacteria bacterium]|nr:hypothetical protein [Pseudomonadota bacterium]